MKYRCPYCKEVLPTPPPPLCPACQRNFITPQHRQPNQRLARKRQKELIRRKYEQKKTELATPVKPSILRSPRLTFGIIFLMFFIGYLVFRAADKPGELAKRQTTPLVRVVANIDVLAEALGRYRFHVGRFPTHEEGLAALVFRPHHIPPGWNGPYINHIIPDPWGTPFVYEPPATSNGLPLLLSCGADQLLGTPDDITPDPAKFDPGTTWTNEWVSALDRLPGVKVLHTPPGTE